MAVPRASALLLATLVVLATLNVNAQDAIKIFYKTAWKSPKIHYAADAGTWTTSPGVSMEPSTDASMPAKSGWFQFQAPANTKSLEFTFNNGEDVWDNKDGANYKIDKAGVYKYECPATKTPDNGIHIFYKTSWKKPMIHYSINEGDWSPSPGVAMEPSTNTSLPAKDGWFQFATDASADTIEFTFNNGEDVWDSNERSNYRVDDNGVFTYECPPDIDNPSQVPSPSQTATPSDAPSTPPSPSSAPSPKPSGSPAPSPPDLGDCGTFQDSCPGISYNESTESRRWQTPPRNSSGWSEEFQDMRSLQGYAHVEYSADRKSATVNVRTFLRDSTDVTCMYQFNDATEFSATFKATSSLKDALKVTATCSKSTSNEQWSLKLDPINFVWQNTEVKQPESMEKGQKGAIVDLFGWPYKDIEAECKDFLGKAGYMGVKINPPQETVLSDVLMKEGQRNPWYLVYQPVSYRLFSRMGSRDELRSMIQTCRANGVRVYADAVVNHMAAGGNDAYPLHRKKTDTSCETYGAHSSAIGSPYWSHGNVYTYNNYTGQVPAMEFPAVPYGPSDFHCDRKIGDYNDLNQLVNGWLVNLADLDTSKAYVRERIAQFFVDLLGIGFSGIRVDALKHMHPADVAAIFGNFNKYMGGSLPEDFISWGEVLLGKTDKFLVCDETSEINFYRGLDNRYKSENISDADIEKIKIWSSDYPGYYPICGSWVLPASRFVIQNDDHDQQAPGSSSRDMDGKGSVLIKDKDVDKHRKFEQELFTRTDADWKVKVVFSSYTFTSDGATGFPDGKSVCLEANGKSCAHNMPYEKAFRQGSCGYTVEDFAGGKYTRVHRDLSIVNAMRGWLGLDKVTKEQVGITGEC
ncbi:hypothetical protein Poli38472_006831 [Pythium oligandrum]|uniref:Alpha-amylase n=1 Tax=Pythium oligandrum TaxID=41045 RepID=A0A8K1FC54_PYTOL|nr:hypothetical protein Poli38472_006831 [Pythium oligandrum]|eukprot:TMW56821.1 hypothetical protein Poli38472_006831 [Pythium oligandrum]